MPDPSASRIVVVEDEETMRYALQVQLQGAGFDVAVTANVFDARKKIESVEPHLVILDIGLNEGPDGLTLARELAGDGPPAVMVLTAAGAKEDEHAGYDAGIDETWSSRPTPNCSSSTSGRCCGEWALPPRRPCASVTWSSTSLPTA